MDMFPTTGRGDMFPSTTDINLINSTHIENVAIIELPNITRHLKLKCLTLKIKNFKFASNLREDF